MDAVDTKMTAKKRKKGSSAATKVDASLRLKLPVVLASDDGITGEQSELPRHASHVYMPHHCSHFTCNLLQCCETLIRLGTIYIHYHRAIIINIILLIRVSTVHCFPSSLRVAFDDYFDCVPTTHKLAFSLSPVFLLSDWTPGSSNAPMATF